MVDGLFSMWLCMCVVKVLYSVKMVKVMVMKMVDSCSIVSVGVGFLGVMN